MLALSGGTLEARPVHRSQKQEEEASPDGPSRFFWDDQKRQAANKLKMAEPETALITVHVTWVSAKRPLPVSVACFPHDWKPLCGLVTANPTHGLRDGSEEKRRVKKYHTHSKKTDEAHELQ